MYIVLKKGRVVKMFETLQTDRAPVPVGAVIEIIAIAEIREEYP